MYDSVAIIQKLEHVSCILSGVMQDVLRSASSYSASVACDGGNSFTMYFTIFMLACFVGYYVIWKVTPSLHAPLMSITNAISSIIVVGAIISAGQEHFFGARIFGFLGVLFAAINIFGGFMITYRMLAMFKSNK